MKVRGLRLSKNFSAAMIVPVPLRSSTVEQLASNFYFEERSHIMIIDAVKTGKNPGTIVRIEDPPAYFRDRTSPHQIGLADVLGIAAITDKLPRNITLFGIEPKQLSTGLTLSTEVAQNLSRLVDMVVAELKTIGINVRAKNK